MHKRGAAAGAVFIYVILTRLMLCQTFVKVGRDNTYTHKISEVTTIKNHHPAAL